MKVVVAHSQSRKELVNTVLALFEKTANYRKSIKKLLKSTSKQQNMAKRYQWRPLNLFKYQTKKIMEEL